MNFDGLRAVGLIAFFWRLDGWHRKKMLQLSVTPIVTAPGYGGNVGRHRGPGTWAGSA